MTAPSHRILYYNGFESGTHVNGQSGAPVGAAQATGARTGSYGLKLGNGHAWVSTPYRDVLGSGSTVNTTITGMAFSFYILTWSGYTAGDAPPLASPRGAIDSPYLLIDEVAGNRKLKLCVGDNGGTPAGPILYTFAPTLALATVYCVEILTYNSAGAASTRNWPIRVKLFSNTGQLLDDSGWHCRPEYTTNTATVATMNSCALGPGHGVSRLAGTYEFVYDDLVIAQGPPPHMPKITPMFPNAVGTDTGWTNDHTNIDEVGAPDGLLISATANAIHETYNLPNSGLAAADNILGVGVWLYGKRTGGTIVGVRPRLRTSSGAATGWLTCSTTALAYYAAGFTNSVAGNGFTATGGAETDIDAMEIGVTSAQVLGSGTAWDVDRLWCEIISGQNYNYLSGTTLNEAIDLTETGFDVVDATKFQVNDLIDIDDEWNFVTAIAAPTLTVSRTLGGAASRGAWTRPAAHASGAAIRLHPWFSRQRGSV